MNLQNATFVRSAVGRRDFPDDGRPQIVFSGRSNVGKSSVINRLLGRRNFARVGGVPGKTAHINFFDIDGTAYFVDLPGYGYAKVSRSERERWGRLMETYFATGLISFGVMLVDARHKPTADDVTMSGWFKESGCPFLVAANKADKLKKSELEPNLACIREVLTLDDNVKVIYFSAETGEGKQAVLGALGSHLGLTFA
ncbi:MAG TPA: ribosome biogenesis GTP-binding protein YihA/YsxC [Oscillospiraceae bacterium]|nr:ribosome biogenesis GTP-binding protein YihA/YsxC [Oscillospiraceae bacterium]